ncbi:MAG TPA: hypothetical protein VN181_14160 [Thermoanaerobaculia bacterium]|nr:hypothetical protein [Thermoanaerobaculia bacterium]
MKVTEEDLRRLYEESTVPDDAAACLDTDLLIRAAGKELGDAERDAVAGHIARCSDCARAYRVARSMRDLTGSRSAMPRSTWSFAAGAIAAMLLLFVPAAIWFARVRDRDRSEIAALEKKLAERPVAVALSTTPTSDELTRPQLDAPIVDLDSDVTRGGTAPAAASVVVPEHVDLFTTILHFDEPARGTIEIAIEGPARWSGSWQVATPAAVLPLTLHRKRFPSGAYVVRTRAGGREAAYSFRVAWR